MIWKVLKSNVKKFQLIAAFAGVLCGLSMLAGAFMFYADIKQILIDNEGFWRDEYVVVNKNIHLSDSYKQIRRYEAETPSFSEAEISQLKKQTFIKEVAPFVASTFNVSIFTKYNSQIPGFYSDLFFEAIPDSYIDVNVESWDWNESDSFLPIIIPRSYLNLYNFGFAQSQGLPQISEDGIGAISFIVSVSGNDISQEFRARIAGFSNRINTFLVPMKFMKWANMKFGSQEAYQPGRLIIISDDPSDPLMMDYFNERQYRIEGNIFNNTRALVFLRALTTIVFLIGSIIILLALWLMIVSLLLLLERNQENINRLALLGFLSKNIYRPFTILITTVIIISWFCSAIPVHFLRVLYDETLVQLGYSTDPLNYYTAMGYSLLAALIFSFFLTIFFKKQIIKMVR